MGREFPNHPTPASRLARRFDRHRGLVVALIVGLSVFACLGLLRDEQPRSLESRLDQEAFALLESVQQDFSVTESSLFLVVEAQDHFSSASTAAMLELLASVRAIEGIEEVIGLDRIPVVEGLGVSTPLLPGENASELEREHARNLARAHALVAGQLLSLDEGTLLLPVRVHPDHENDETTLAVDGVARRVSAGGALSVRVTGLLPIFAESERVFAEERVFFMVAGFVLAALFAWALFKSFSAVIIAGVAPGLGVLWTLGSLRWLDESSNDMTNIVLPILLMMIGFTDGIHLIVHVRKARRADRSPRESAMDAISSLGGACMWTSVTTAVGFGSLMVAGSAYASEFGRACAIGVVLTFIAVVTTIPLLAGSRLSKGIHHGWSRDPVDRLVVKLESLVDFVLLHARVVMALGLIATLVLLLIGLQLRPNYRFSTNMPDGSESYEALMHVDEVLGGVQFGRVVISWPEGTDGEAILEATKDVEATLDGESLYAGSLSIRDLQSVVPGGGQSLAASTLLPPRLRAAFLNKDKRRALVTARIRDDGFLRYEPAYAETERELERLEKVYPGFEFELTGDPIFYGRNLAQVTSDLVGSLGLAAAVILAVLWFVFRSWKIGLLSIFPNVFPLAVTASLLYWVEDGGLELASVCSFTICLGIAVDDTIHFLTRFQRERALTDDFELAIHRAVRGVGGALVTTTIVLVVGFGIVLTSKIQVNRIFAGMGCTTIAAALVGDLVLLPAMLKVVLDRSPAKR